MVNLELAIGRTAKESAKRRLEYVTCFESPLEVPPNPPLHLLTQSLGVPLVEFIRGRLTARLPLIK